MAGILAEAGSRVRRLGIVMGTTVVWCDVGTWYTWQALPGHDGYASIGNALATDNTWTAAGTNMCCSEQYPLICFEQ